MEKWKIRKQWFLDRIGKRVFRNKTSCECGVCANVSKKGLIISDEMHAEYLFDIEGSYTHDGYPLRYFDSKWKAKLFAIKSYLTRKKEK